MSCSKMYLLAFLVVFLNVQNTLTQVYHVIDFNATGNGIADDTNAVRAAVAAAINSNGGRVVFDAGYTFLTGCFNISSNFILDIRGTILGSQNSDHYALVDPLPWNGIEEGSGPLDRQALIEVYNASNITITGGGVIDGQGAPWWACSWNASLFVQPPCSNLSRNGITEGSGPLDRQALIEVYNASNITLTGGGVIDGQGAPWWFCLRNDTSKPPCLNLSRPNLVRLINTVDITVYNLTMKDSPSWTFHLANTTNVHVYNFKALASNKSHNTDGIDIECSVNVLVEDYFYNGNDDAIAVKSGINWLGRTYGRTTENVLVRNVTVGQPGFTLNSGLSIGSEMSGGVRNVTFDNCRMYGSVTGIFVKTERLRGGVVENITYKNMYLQNNGYGSPIQISMNFAKNLPPGNETSTPKFRNIRLENVVVDQTVTGWVLDGLPESPIENATFSNITITGVSKVYVGTCDNIYGFCDNSTVSPYCPSCIVQECLDAIDDCTQYLNLCANPKYQTTLCSICRRSCNLCTSCNGL